MDTLEENLHVFLRAENILGNPQSDTPPRDRILVINLSPSHTLHPRKV
jgi:hypothetical protein